MECYVNTQILRSAAERVRFSGELGQTEISKSDVTGLVHQDVLRFQVSVEDLTLVQVAQSQGYLCCIETSPFL